jgi:hypothetical protein
MQTQLVSQDVSYQLEGQKLSFHFLNGDYIWWIPADEAELEKIAKDIFTCFDKILRVHGLWSQTFEYAKWYNTNFSDFGSDNYSRFITSLTCKMIIDIRFMAPKSQDFDLIEF